MVSAAQPTWTLLPAAQAAASRGDVGTLLHLARIAAQLTLVEAGELVGYSAATLSRMETGNRQVTDVLVLRRLATAFCIPLGMLGLTTSPLLPQTGHLTSPATVEKSSTAAQEDSDPMRRRELLLGLATAPLVVASMGTAPSLAAGAAGGAGLIEALTSVLLHTEAPIAPALAGDDGLDVADADLPRLSAELAVCMGAFQASRYDVLAVRLPALVRRVDALGPDRLSRVRAEIYNTVAKVLIKFETAGMGWIATDRALLAARASGDPEVVASCARSAVSLCRRDGHYASAQDLALQACQELTVTGQHPDPGHLSLYGMLLCNAGYAAAQAGDRSRSAELLNLAGDASHRLGSDRNEHWTAFGPTNVTLHRISAAFALGDAGIAINHARTVNPTNLLLPERQSRYWVDVARAYHQWGKPDRCLEALSIAERQAPGEVRSRPVVRHLLRDLLDTPAPLPGVRNFAHRVGALS